MDVFKKNSTFEHWNFKIVLRLETTAICFHETLGTEAEMNNWHRPDSVLRVANNLLAVGMCRQLSLDPLSQEHSFARFIWQVTLTLLFCFYIHPCTLIDQIIMKPSK